MAIGKWIGGVLGWIASGGSILGALAGYCIGSLLDDAMAGSTTSRQTDSYGGQAGSDYSSSTNEGDRNSFLFSMLVLFSYIIRADGKVMHSEMEYVRNFLRQNFGAAAAVQGEEILLKLFEEQKREGNAAFKETIRKACVEMRFHMNYGMRLQLLSFLVGIANADGHVAQAEVDALREVAQVMGLLASDVESILAMGDFYQRSSGNSYGNDNWSQSRKAAGGDQLTKAYKILGISPSATDDEVKKAYRQMALKHHPDKVATLGDDVRQAAEKKFKEINEAKETIYKARGL